MFRIKNRFASWLAALFVSTIGLSAALPATVVRAQTTPVAVHTATKKTTVQIVSSNLYVHHNQYASVTIHTSPGAHCTIEVVYKSGSSHAKGLDAKTAPSSGVVTWSWKIGPSTTLGTWPVYITANNTSIHTYLHVQRA
ncbi:MULTISPECIES: hypothetical protein [Alicyclobacillus]|uniref:Uncharacterized protein n=1 Tax=Alicyclobacillus acidoterrestris (strain ATCC 49025 / DSM 3922 / CIP 106132 / NCIMB 13137 / GD3B) TaxID=1356854 RepID=A0A9E7CT04_ALIAG|nr:MULTISPECIES: hypothetical protein [Alicyclobacillus]UNO50485.1 hypothetical protein K1I37_08515 [Alicyclobacillus acidoterrestris]